MSAKTTHTDDVRRGLYWSMAVTRKLHRTAISERRFTDANYYAKRLQALELDARALLNSKGVTP